MTAESRVTKHVHDWHILTAHSRQCSTCGATGPYPDAAKPSQRTGEIFLCLECRPMREFDSDSQRNDHPEHRR